MRLIDGNRRPLPDPAAGQELRNQPTPTPRITPVINPAGEAAKVRTDRFKPARACTEINFALFTFSRWTRIFDSLGNIRLIQSQYLPGAGKTDAHNSSMH